MDRLYPVFLKLSGLACLVVGGGAVATRKVTGLLACGAEVTVISPCCTSELAELAEQGMIRLEKRTANQTDVAGFRFVFLATNDPAANEELALAARAAGSFVNVADSPELSSFFVPAVVDKGRLRIAISTSGASPALAKQIRQELDAHFGPEYELALETEAFLRGLILETVPQADRPAVFRLLAEGLPAACRTAKSPCQFREELVKLLGISIPCEFEQLVSPFFR